MNTNSCLKDLHFCSDTLLRNEELSKYTTYKIGGPANYFVSVDNIGDLVAILNCINDNNLDYYILGGGSNLLVSDTGYAGCIIKLGCGFDYINNDNKNSIYECGCAIALSKLIKKYFDDCNEGAEFLHGIPGTLGGAIKMNAGRKDQWISSIIDSVQIIDNNGNLQNKKTSEIDWGYRYSSIKDDEIIVSANLKFKDCDNVEVLQSKISELKEMRKETQPLDKLTCGSVFKNPHNYSAGKLIEEVGLKGKTIGGAQVSDKHANFIVNSKNAKASDVVELIRLIQNTIFDKYNIKLIPEVKFLGFDEQCSLF